MMTRGDGNCIWNRLEVMKRIKSKTTIDLLEQIQKFYEVRGQRIALEGSGAEMEYVEQAEREAYCQLLERIDLWMQAPTKVKFR